MSASAPTTKIFGLRLGVDPKYLIAGLVAVAILLFWMNSRSDSDTTSPTRPVVAAPPTQAPARAARANRRTNTNLGAERNVLAMRPIDASKGDVDPTLRLDLLSRVKAVEPGAIGRSIFEIGSTPQEQAAALAAAKAPIIAVKPMPPPVPQPPPEPVVNVPFKYYGYAKPGEKTEVNRGLFLDDKETVMVATEGQTLQGHYLVVELTPNSARIEDTQLKKGKMLPVIPQAQQQ